jgi:hypothetical protein
MDLIDTGRTQSGSKRGMKLYLIPLDHRKELYPPKTMINVY